MSRASRHWWWLLLVLPLIWGWSRLRFDVDVLNLLPSHLPVVEGLRLQQKHFAGSQELVITLSAPDADQARDFAFRLATDLRRQRDRVRSVAWQPPLLEAPAESAELLAWLWLNQPPEVFARFIDRLGTNRLHATLNEARDALTTTLTPGEIARLGYDPLGFTQLPDGLQGPAGMDGEEAGFASVDGTFRVLFVTPAKPLSDYRACHAWIQDLGARVEELKRQGGIGPEVKTAFTGGPAFTAEIATGMERDMRGSTLGTLFVVALLFWIAHRRWIPLFWLISLSVFVLLGTLALGGLVFGSLNVVSLGFAAILLGLADDYALVLHQEASAEPHLSVAAVRRTHAPGILWSAVTTACAFGLLPWAGLPGLAQLGTLVALGVLLAAVVMLFGFLPVAVGRHGAHPNRPRPSSSKPSGCLPASVGMTELECEVPSPCEEQAGRGEGRGAPPHPSLPAGAKPRASAPPWVGLRLGLGASLVVGLACVLLLARGWPAVDRSADALQPGDLAAARALREMETRLGAQREPVTVLVTGRDEVEVADRLVETERVLRGAFREVTNLSLILPTAVWPTPDHQRANLARVDALKADPAVVKAAAGDVGFKPEALALADAVLAQWRRFAQAPVPSWPTNELGRWVTAKFAAQTTRGWIAAGQISPPRQEGRRQKAEGRIDASFGATDLAGTSRQQRAEIMQSVRLPAGVYLADWTLLGEALLRHVGERVGWLLGATVVLVAVCLALAFRRWVEVALSFAVLGFGMLQLLAVMAVAGWTWNLMNLTAILLLLGVGVDFTIHIQLALRRTGGDGRGLWRSTGRAVALCAATTLTGFGSLAWSENLGLASFGRLCATGIGCVAVTSLCFLPAWWNCGVGNNGAGRSIARVPPAVPGPSTTYRAGIWRLGLILARSLPAGLANPVAVMAGRLYARLRPERFATVQANLEPIFDGDAHQARAAARRLFERFAAKILDLWRYESGAPVDTWLSEWVGWERLVAARAGGRGVLLVTPHLGNWEFGGPFLARQGVKLLVLTQPEPGNGFTEMRQASRARWGIETIVVRHDPFAFIEVIQRLQDGALVALLIDRPPVPTGVTVELFGRPFQASIAAAELARATGAAILPVYVTRGGAGYRAEVLPEVAYDRAALGHREARRVLTQEILRAFEPVIRQHPDQWYHFVPLWTAPDARPS